MKKITFYLDFISPYAYLAFEQLPRALQGHSYLVEHRPVLFAALLKHHGQLGPAEIPGKREWTYRQVIWLAAQLGIPLDMPAQHPFNPLPLLRLAVASDARGLPNRYVCETLFRHVWRGGADPADQGRLTTLRDSLPALGDAGEDLAKARLKASTDQAIAAGVFGVPTFEVDGRLFWGLDALPMVRAYLDGHEWFAASHWDDAAKVSTGATRRVAG